MLACFATLHKQCISSICTIVKRCWPLRPSHMYSDIGSFIIHSGRWWHAHFQFRYCEVYDPEWRVNFPHKKNPLHFPHPKPSRKSSALPLPFRRCQLDHTRKAAVHYPQGPDSGKEKYSLGHVATRHCWNGWMWLAMEFQNEWNGLQTCSLECGIN